MDRTDSRRWMQFSLRSLLLLMFAVACFFAGRMSLQQELNRARAIEAEVRRVQAALAAERDARYQAAITRVQAVFDQAVGEMAIPEPDDNSSAPN